MDGYLFSAALFVCTDKCHSLIKYVDDVHSWSRILKVVKVLIELSDAYCLHVNLDLQIRQRLAETCDSCCLRPVKGNNTGSRMTLYAEDLLITGYLLCGECNSVCHTLFVLCCSNSDVPGELSSTSLFKPQLTEKHKAG